MEDLRETDVKYIQNGQVNHLLNTYLGMPKKACEEVEREFGRQFLAPNRFSGPGVGSLEGKGRVLAESLCLFNPYASSHMISHENEIRENVHVIGDDHMTFTEGFLTEDGPKIRQQSHGPGSTFIPYARHFNKPEEETPGFYHSLANDNRTVIAATVSILADESLAMEGSERLEYGLNRPPSTWDGPTHIIPKVSRMFPPM